jgi:hypothetical protein
MVACWFRPQPCLPSLRNNRGPCRSVDCNRVQDKRTSDTSFQKGVLDAGFPQQESSECCGKGTAGKYCVAFEASLDGEFIH